MLHQVMEYEAEQQSGAGRYVRGSGRRAHRNGYRERTLSTRHGLLKLSKPQLREFPFRTKVFETYSRVENALTNVIMESYLQGVATRDVRSVVEQLENTAILDRPIEDEIAFLVVDASYFKVRRQDMCQRHCLLLQAYVQTVTWIHCKDSRWRGCTALGRVFR